jgi:ubiquinone/menaquinone biosynthesis C-methylase UbiE
MPATDTVFAGSIPGLYDRYMVPLIFAPYAGLVAERARALEPGQILETAAGTGVVTEALHRALPDAQIVATDLNPAMLDVAAARIRSARVVFQPADAQALPFQDSSFDLVVCQFGIMFVPDKVKANAEARRVLRDAGRYLLVIWDRVERNLATRIAGEAVANLFPEDAGSFYERLPFRYHDPAQIEHDLIAAGFDDIESRPSSCEAGLLRRGKRRSACARARRCGPRSRSAARTRSSGRRKPPPKRWRNSKGRTGSTRRCRRTS